MLVHATAGETKEFNRNLEPRVISVSFVQNNVHQITNKLQILFNFVYENAINHE